MKVVAKDNLNRDYHPDKLITQIGLSKEICEVIANTLNGAYSGNCAVTFYSIEEDEYKLYTESMEDLIS